MSPIRMFAVAVACLVVSSFVASVTLAADQVPNPAYQSWSRYKPGTSVLMKRTMNMQGMTIRMDAYNELKSVADDKVVVTMWTVMDMGPIKRETPRRDITIHATVDKGSDQVPAGMEGRAEVVGDEKVSVGGKEYDCKVVQFSGKNEEGNEANGKLWTTPDVPGNTVKLDMKFSGAHAGDMVAELAEVNEKK
jgi:hypothetical protein